MTIFLIADQSTFPLTEIIFHTITPFFPPSIQFRIWGTIEDQHDIWTWDSLFKVGKTAKAEEDSGDKEVYFVFLYEGLNLHNWFCSFDIEEPTVAFLQCSGWEGVGISKPKYAIIYHLFTIVTAMKFFGKDKEPFGFYHEKSIGCMFDLTENKTEVIHKLKSAHICTDCVESIAHSSHDQPDALVYLNGVKAVLEWVRNELYQVEFNPYFKKLDYKLIIEEDLALSLEINNENISLPIGKGRETAIFMMLLKHRKGLSYDDFMKPQFLNEYLDLYLKYYVSNYSKESLLRQSKAEMEKGTFKSNLHSSVSKMKTKLKTALKHYKDVNKELEIQSVNGRIMIRINPKYLVNKNRDIDL